MDTQTLYQLLSEAFPDSKVELTGDGYHFDVVIISERFKTLSRLARQRLVYETVQTQIAGGALHALSMKTYTPEEWQNGTR